MTSEFLGGKERTRPLEKLEGDPSARLTEAVQNQETIVVCGMPMWERIELLDVLARVIPRQRRVLVFEDRAATDPRLKEATLPPNHVVMYYNNPGGVVPLKELAKAALHMAGDYLIVPNLQSAEVKDFMACIAFAFEGTIVAVDAVEDDQRLRSVADVLIKTVSDKVAPLGIGAVWARPLRE